MVLWIEGFKYKVLSQQEWWRKRQI